MTINISEELANVDARLKEVEPLVLSVNRFIPLANENHKRRFSQEQLLGNKFSSKKDKRSYCEDAECDDGASDQDEEPETKRTVSSIVLTPSAPSPSLSREKRLEELGKSADRMEKARNRRMFSNLLGALENRRKDASATKQAEKIQEVEKKLDDAKQLQIQKAREEKERRLQKAKEAEDMMNQLKRKKALLQYADQKISHYELLKNAIQTKTKPVIFFLPAKHSVRSLELLKNSQENIDHLIEIRKVTLVKELSRPMKVERNANESPPSRIGKPKVTSVFKTERDRSRSRSFSRSDDDGPHSEEEPGEKNPVSIVEIPDEDVYRREPNVSFDNEE